MMGTLLGVLWRILMSNTFCKMYDYWLKVTNYSVETLGDKKRHKLWGLITKFKSLQCRVCFHSLFVFFQTRVLLVSYLENILQSQTITLSQFTVTVRVVFRSNWLIPLSLIQFRLDVEKKQIPTMPWTVRYTLAMVRSSANSSQVVERGCHNTLKGF